MGKYQHSKKFRALDSPNNNISTACPKHRDRQFLRPPKAPRKTYLHTSKWRAQPQISALMSLHDTRRSLLTQQTPRSLQSKKQTSCRTSPSSATQSSTSQLQELLAVSAAIPVVHTIPSQR